MRSSNLTWADLKKELSIHYSIIPSNTHANHTFTHLEQGPDRLLDNFLHHKVIFYQKYITLLTCLGFQWKAPTTMQ